MAKLTATQQRNAVSEGAALGLLTLGRNSIPYNKVMVDLSFTGAWRNWPWRTRFSQVDTDIRHGLHGSLVLTRAGESKRTFALFWERNRELEIYARGTFDDDEPSADLWAEMLTYIDGDVPLLGWTQLAKDFLDRLER